MGDPSQTSDHHEQVIQRICIREEPVVSHNRPACSLRDRLRSFVSVTIAMAAVDRHSSVCDGGASVVGMAMEMSSSRSSSISPNSRPLSQRDQPSRAGRRAAGALASAATGGAAAGTEAGNEGGGRPCRLSAASAS